MRQVLVFVGLLVLVQSRFWFPSDDYSHDGTGNNLQNPNWGKAGNAQVWKTYFIDMTPGITKWNFNAAVSPRVVSNAVGSGGKLRIPPLTPRNLSDFIVVWAQFVDHDLDLTPTGSTELPIPIPRCDPIFDPECTGNQTMPFVRSLTSSKDVTIRPNMVTQWLDLSQVYGSSEELNEVLRSGSGGRLRVSELLDGEFPPMLKELKNFERALCGTANAGPLDSDELFCCGDVRCNENPLLTTMQILFLREHNRVADHIASKFKGWSDDSIYKAARRYVVAEYQRIVFDEYLFWLIGGVKWPLAYTGYNSKVAPDTHIFFSTAGFRYGHSEVVGQIKRMHKGKYGNFPMWQYTRLSDAFFNPSELKEYDIGTTFEGMATVLIQSMDEMEVDEIRNELFQNGAGHPILDLYSLDIQRGRDHFLPTYNKARIAYGLEPAQNWADFEALDEDDNSDPQLVRRKLNSVYATPEECDSIVCGNAEDWVHPENRRIAFLNKLKVRDIPSIPDDYSHIGDLFEHALFDQFTRARDGDRFWYQKDLKRVQVSGLTPPQSRKLSDVIRDNTDAIIHDDVFIVASAAHLIGTNRADGNEDDGNGADPAEAD